MSTLNLALITTLAILLVILLIQKCREKILTVQRDALLREKRELEQNPEYTKNV